MVTKLCHNYKLTLGIFRVRSLSSLCALFIPIILRNMVIFFFMLQSHSDALIFWIDTFHIRRHKIFKKFNISGEALVRPCIVRPYGDQTMYVSQLVSLECRSTTTTPLFNNIDDRVQGGHAP